MAPEDQLDQITKTLTVIDKTVAVIESRLAGMAELSDRVRSLETWRWKVTGAALGVAGLSGGLWEWLGQL